ncbi:MAG: methyltransferase domain-containing protein [Rhodospirillaceae bacterium]
MVQKNAPVPPAAKCLGPVNDLERHLPSDWWRTLFNALYIKTDGDVVEHDGNTAREVDLLVTAAGLDSDDRILDICCGQGRHSLELARRGFRHVTGLDRSRYLIRLARKRARTLGLPVTFHEGDARKFRMPEGGFHCVTILGNSFGYFDREDEDVSVLKAAQRALRSGGTLVLDITDGDWMRTNFERRSWEWIDQDHFVCRERSLSSDGDRLISREVVVHAEKGVIADQFYAERLYSRAKIIELLERAGFRAVRFHAVAQSESSRNQDLGMMARRMFLTAQAPAKAAASPARGRPAFPEVTVLLGDPRLPDTVKMGGQFNAEDYATVDRLKAALGTLGEYRFVYLDNHGSLIPRLRAERPAFVLNLCDEGYNNDAFLELHVPALLEMLAIPYSGAGPACLGMCYDKALVRAVAMAFDVPVPLETVCDIGDQSATMPSVFPALIKPNCGDSSIGITKDAVVHNPEEAIAYLRRLRDLVPGRAALVQEYLPGTEYSVGLVGNPGLGMRVLPILEVDYSRLDAGLPPILSYESKWDPASPYWSQIKYREARADDDAKRRMVDNAITLFERLGCRDYARFDFRTDAAGEIKLLEVNPNPGWCWDGKMNFMAEFEGHSYADLLRWILEAAQARLAAGRSAVTAQPAMAMAAGQ